MSDRPAQERDGRGAERIVAAILVFMAVVLGYLRFGFLPKGRSAPTQVFDLKNPMLDARVGELVEVEELGSGDAVTCIRVIEPGLVTRPSEGVETLGAYEGLRRMRPYLACEVLTPPPGEKCTAAKPGRRHDYLLFDLVGFGMPARIPIEAYSIRPVWRRWSGKTHHTYEIVMNRYGAEAGANVLWVTEDAPVVGVVYREYSQGRERTHQIYYREVAAAP